MNMPETLRLFQPTWLTRVKTKVDGIAADLAGHRTDTEAHRGVYQVREE
jgi:hypothetical protein